jgi:hypothetical protein
MTNSIPMNNHFSTPVNAQELHFDKLFEQLSDFVKLNRRQPSKSDDMVLWGVVRGHALPAQSHAVA